MAEAVVIGECMVELSLDGAGGAAVGYAGDTFNTAVYLSRLGVPTAYATALGAGDPFSAGVLALMAREGIGGELVVEAAGRLPGLYAILRDAAGERSFFYWRGEAPARDYLRLADLPRLAQALGAAPLIYVSAITLAILGEAERETLTALLAGATAAGAGVALDTNYRARLWADGASARAAIEAVAPACRWISASAEDLEGFGEGPDAAVRWAAAGAEVVLRRRDHAVEVLRAGDREVIAAHPPVAALDTTGAGDAFNAAYLAARLEGRAPAQAVAEGRRLAGAVVGCVGAIIPREAMP